MPAREAERSKETMNIKITKLVGALSIAALATAGCKSQESAPADRGGTTQQGGGQSTCSGGQSSCSGGQRSSTSRPTGGQSSCSGGSHQ